MIIDLGYSVATLVVVALVTALTRAMPYLIFGRKKEIHPTVQYLSNALPPAIIIILVVYCLRNIDLTAYPFGLGELISLGVVIAMQFTKENIFLSIFLGTACYMILIRTVFLI